MSKNFHRDYADSVGHFCQSIPSELGITSQEIDTYVRACTLCLWAASGGRGGDVIGINQIYTDRQVKFTGEQFSRAIAYYQNNPNYTVGVPEFFQKLAKADAKAGTSFSRTFAEVQKNLLMLCAAYDGSFSFAESRRITLLYGQLSAVCDKEGVSAIAPTPGPEDYLDSAPQLTMAPERPPQQDAAQELDKLMNEFDQVIRRDRTRGIFDDFYGGQPGNPWPPCPLRPAGRRAGQTAGVRPPPARPPYRRRNRSRPSPPWRRPWRSSTS